MVTDRGERHQERMLRSLRTWRGVVYGPYARTSDVRDGDTLLCLSETPFGGEANRGRLFCVWGCRSGSEDVTERRKLRQHGRGDVGNALHALDQPMPDHARRARRLHGVLLSALQRSALMDADRRARRRGGSERDERRERVLVLLSFVARVVELRQSDGVARVDPAGARPLPVARVVVAPVVPVPVLLVVLRLIAVVPRVVLAAGSAVRRETRRPDAR